MHYLDPFPANPRPVLLLHGLGATAASWEAQLPALGEAGFRPIAVDLPGFGKTPYRGRGWSPEYAANEALALLESLWALPADVVGISMGGTVALAAAVGYPQVVHTLTLVNTFAALRPRNPGGWAYFALRMLIVHTLGLEAQGRAVVRRIFPRPEQEGLRQALLAEILQADPRAYRAAMRALVRFDVRRRLADIRIPTLVITGSEDTTVPLEAQRALAEGIPGAQHITIAGAGHGVIADSPDRFNAALLTFLTGHTTA